MDGESTIYDAGPPEALQHMAFGGQIGLDIFVMFFFFKHC